MSVARHCGGCTLCCRLVAAVDVNSTPLRRKPAGVLCSHCDDGRGCRIHAERPPTCRAFQCLWTTDPSLGDDLRPDRCGVIFEAHREHATALALVDENRPASWFCGGPRAVVDRLLGESCAVWIIVGSDRYRLLPPGTTEEAAAERLGAIWDSVRHGSA